MGVFHIVMLSFKPEATPEQIKMSCQGMSDLQKNSIHPKTKKPYIKSLVGGHDVSPEGLQDGITHAWVMEFENEEDWKYYLEKEVANVDLDKEMLQYVKHAQVVDFKPDQF